MFQFRPSAEACTAMLLATTAATTASANVLDLFDDRAAWQLAAAAPIDTEGFEGRFLEGPINDPSLFNSGLALSVSGQAAAFSAVESGDPFFQDLQNTTPNGENYARFGVGGLTGDYTITFNLPVATSAFGFDISDWEPGNIDQDFQGANVELRNNGSLVIGFDIPSSQSVSGAVSFLGFTSDTFTWGEVRFTVNELNAVVGGAPGMDVTGIDEVSWAVPSPGSATLLAFAGIGAARRRR